MQAVTAILPFFPIQALIDGYAIEPRGKFSLATVSSDLPERLDKGFLGEIFGVRERSGHPECQGMNHALMARDERLERGMIASLALVDPTKFFVDFNHAAFF